MSRGPRLVPVGLALLIAGIFYVSASAQERVQLARNVTEQQDEQKRIQAETDQTARRIGTMLRLLTYHNLDKTAEQKLLNEAATTLGKLSKEQMTQVLAHLEAAGKATDGSKAQTEIDAAYQRHREVLEKLKNLLTKYDVIKTLDQAAERLERLAREENELYITSVALSQDLRENRLSQRRS